jgi:UV DNA damage endonuclease
MIKTVLASSCSAGTFAHLRSLTASPCPSVSPLLAPSFTMAKRERSSIAAVELTIPSPVVRLCEITSLASQFMPPKPVRQPSNRQKSQSIARKVDTNPDTNPKIEDGEASLRASPDAEEPGEKLEAEKATRKVNRRTTAVVTPKPAKRKELSSGLELSDLEAAAVEIVAEKSKSGPRKKTSPKKEEAVETTDPEADGEELAHPEEIKEALSKPPPVNSDYLPLPWKGMIGYACLNTYLRTATPPVFSSRTCRIASILEHRHPLKDPSARACYKEQARQGTTTRYFSRTSLC